MIDLSSVRVPTGNVTVVVIALFIAIGLPFLLMLFWRKKTGSKIYPFFIGMGVFLIFAMLLESILHIFVLEATGTLFSENYFLYALYGGLTAGIFEETGRFVAMKFLMKKALGKEESIMYGLGHGGFESIITLGMTEISNLIIIMTINLGFGQTLISSLSETDAAMVIEQVRPLWEASPSLFVMGIVERILAMALHVGLSYIVYRAVKDGKVYLYIAAMLIHAFVDSVTAWLSKSGVRTAVVETVLLVMILVIYFFVIKIYRAEKSEPEAA